MACVVSYRICVFVFCSSQGKDSYLSIIHKYADIHSTVFIEKAGMSIVPDFVHNHGIMTGPDLHRLLRESKVRSHNETLVVTGSPRSEVTMKHWL